MSMRRNERSVVPADVEVIVSGLNVINATLQTSFEYSDFFFPPRFRDLAASAWSSERNRINDIIAQLRSSEGSSELRKRLEMEGLAAESLRLKHELVVWSFDRAAVRIDNRYLPLTSFVGLAQNPLGLWINRGPDVRRGFWAEIREKFRAPAKNRVRALLGEILEHSEPFLESVVDSIPVVGKAAVEIVGFSKTVHSGRTRERRKRAVG